MPRTVFLLGPALFLVALAFLATDALLWRPGVTAANLRRVHEGMTLAEVQALFEEPGIAIRDLDSPLPPNGQNLENLHAREWAGDRGRILVWFDGDRAYALERAIWPNASVPLEQLRKALGP